MWIRTITFSRITNHIMWMMFYRKNKLIQRQYFTLKPDRVPCFTMKKIKIEGEDLQESHTEFTYHITDAYTTLRGCTCIIMIAGRKDGRVSALIGRPYLARHRPLPLCAHSEAGAAKGQVQSWTGPPPSSFSGWLTYTIYCRGQEEEHSQT